MLKALRKLPRSSQTYCGAMAEVTGLEPVISASKAGVLPLHYTPICAACSNYQCIIIVPYHVFGTKHIAFSKHCHSL